MLFLARFITVALQLIPDRNPNHLEPTSTSNPNSEEPDNDLAPPPTEQSIPTSQPTTISNNDEINTESFDDIDYIPKSLNFENIEFVFVPEGLFESVSIEAFYIGTYEITNRQFRNFMNERVNNCSQGIDCMDVNQDASRFTRTGGSWVIDEGYEDFPVVEVTWYGANDYCIWLGGRLATEEEWLKAAIWDPETGDSFSYPWGEDTEIANFANVESGILSSVGTFEHGKSVVGAYDMIGNVWEFIAKERSSRRFWRGGSFNTGSTIDIYLEESGEGINSSQSDLGFRCVLDVN